MTLSEIAEKCRELAMAGNQVLYDRSRRVGEAVSDAVRKVTLYRPVKPGDWPTSKAAMAKRRYNPATDVKITYTRHPGDQVVLKQPRKSKVRHVESLQGLPQASLKASRAIKVLEGKLIKHADKNRLHLTTVADPYGNRRVKVDGLSRHYAKLGFKDRTAAAKNRERARLRQQGHTGDRVEEMLASRYETVKVMHRKPRRQQ